MPLIPLLPTNSIGSGISTKLPIKKMSTKIVNDEDNLITTTKLISQNLSDLNGIKKFPISSFFDTLTTVAAFPNGNLPFEPVLDLQTVSISTPASITIRVNIYFTKNII